MIALIKRYTVIAGLLAMILLGMYLYLRHRLGGNTGAKVPAAATKAALPANDNEQLVIDPRSHTITIKRPGKTTVTHLPDRTADIDILKDGTVRVTAQQFGLEHRLFLGAGYSDALRLGIGVDGLYWKALDLGAGLQVSSAGRSPRVFVGLSYNVKDNLRVTVTVDHTQHVGVMLTLRI